MIENEVAVAANCCHGNRSLLVAAQTSQRMSSERRHQAILFTPKLQVSLLSATAAKRPADSSKNPWLMSKSEKAKCSKN